jgi:GntR family transcriptional regulator
MHLTVQPGTELPIYRQVMRQVMDAIRDGRWAPGDQVPSQRDLGQQLGIEWLAVKKACEELERLGHLDTAGPGIPDSLAFRPRSVRKHVRGQ